MIESQKHPVILKLESMAKKDGAERNKLARLRRGLHSPAETYSIILPLLREDAENWEIDRYATLAALFAGHPQSSQSGNFGEHMKFAAGKNAVAAERRFVTLLRANEEDLLLLLSQAVNFLRAKDVPVNWEQLRQDLLDWDHPTRYVQKNWPHGFWHYRYTEKQNRQA